MSVDTLVDRLRGMYQVGPVDGDGKGEFGERSFANFLPPISLEAANRIEDLEKTLKELKERYEGSPNAR